MRRIEMREVYVRRLSIVLVCVKRETMRELEPLQDGILALRQTLGRFEEV